MKYRIAATVWLTMWATTFFDKVGETTNNTSYDIADACAVTLYMIISVSLGWLAAEEYRKDK